MSAHLIGAYVRPFDTGADTDCVGRVTGHDPDTADDADPRVVVRWASGLVSVEYSEDLLVAESPVPVPGRSGSTLAPTVTIDGVTWALSVPAADAQRIGTALHQMAAGADGGALAVSVDGVDRSDGQLPTFVAAALKVELDCLDRASRD